MYCQSVTKPNLVAKILATKFGVFFFVIYIIFQKYIQYESNDNMMKYYGSVIPMTEMWALKKLEGYQLW